METEPSSSEILDGEHSQITDTQKSCALKNDSAASSNSNNITFNHFGISNNVSNISSNGAMTDRGPAALLLPVTGDAAAASTDSSTAASNLCVGDGGAAGAVGEQFLQLAKCTKGAAAVQLVKEALEASGLYVFAELLNMPNIKELSTHPDHSAYYRLLEVFAYGVYDDYLGSSSALPSLSPAMLTKLRHLTIVTMATTAKTLPLDTLVEKLGLNNRRELEDLIIEAIYADVLHGKLDQKNNVLEVDYALGRDIKMEDLPDIAETLKAWCDTCHSLLGTLEGLVVMANKDKEQSNRRKAMLEAEVAKVKSNFKRLPMVSCGGGGDAGEDGISQADNLREMEKKLHRLKKSGATTSQASTSSASSGTMTKPAAKFWPKS